jgi:hypothetical protein
VLGHQLLQQGHHPDTRQRGPDLDRQPRASAGSGGSGAGMNAFTAPARSAGPRVFLRARVWLQGASSQGFTRRITSKT